jgi:predicted dithiol-disulfide oxidoreductase (DUF899 family)
MAEQPLKPAAELASKNTAHFPNESPGYRAARNALLAEEIELRRHLWRVAEMRRALPEGGEVLKPYRFVGAQGEVTLRDLFGDKNTLVVYSMMYGPRRKNACPMCTSLLDSWDGEAPHIEERVALAVVARSPLPRIASLARARHWENLKLFADESGDYTQDYAGDRDADIPAYTVFKRNGEAIHHFYSGEGSLEMADPGQDPHSAPDMNPLWIILDTTPGGRGTDWYPALDDGE